MPLLSLDGLCLAFGQRTIFEEDNLAVERGDRLGIVGPNGTGKAAAARRRSFGGMGSRESKKQGGEALPFKGVKGRCSEPRGSDGLNAQRAGGLGGDGGPCR